MNNFLISAKRFISRHGEYVNYVVVENSNYNVETGSIDNINTPYKVRMYRKHVTATHYNFPNLIGKDAVLFYLANDNLPFIPKPIDSIGVDGSSYSVSAITEHTVNGKVVLYKILATRG